MRIPSKSPYKSIKNKLSNLSPKEKDILNSNKDLKSDKLVSIKINDILGRKSKKTFSVKIVNYIDPYEISGVRYTMFYTEVDHNLNIGDKVFIEGGNYDSDLIIQNNKFDKRSNGYIVKYVDKTKVVLNIEFTNINPFIIDEIDNYIKVYVSSSQEEFDYLTQTTTNRGIQQLVGSSSVPVTSNRFSYTKPQSTVYGTIGTFSSNNFLYINGTFSANGNGIYGFTHSGSTSSTWSNSFLMLDGIMSGYMEDITDYVISGSHSNYLSGGLSIELGLSYSNIVENNGRLKIMNGSFKYGETTFKKGFVYYFNTNNNRWEVDRTYMQPIISEQNFRNGVFKKGSHNQGLFGNLQEEITHDGSNVNFTLGTILNTKWIAGNIGSGAGNQISHTTTLDNNNYPVIKENVNNNGGFGYNYSYNSSIQNSSIQNGNFVETILGSQSSDKIVYNKLQSYSTTYSVLTKGGIYRNCNFEFSKIENSTILKSLINNSEIQKSKSINSEFGRSFFEYSKYISDKSIKIRKYQESKKYWYDGSDLKFLTLHKFYFDEDNFEKISHLRNFYFDGLDLVGGSNKKILNFFDDKFSINDYQYSYDSEDLNGKLSRKMTIQISSKEDNKFEFSSTYSDLNLLSENPSYGLPSIDLCIDDPKAGFIGDSNCYIDINLPYTQGWLPYPILGTLRINYIDGSLDYADMPSPSSGPEISASMSQLSGESWTFDDQKKRLINATGSSISFIQLGYGFIIFSFSVVQNVDPTIDISNAYIVDSDFKSGLFKNSEWINGNHINYNKDYSILTNSDGYYATSSIGTSSGPKIEIDIGPNLRTELFEYGDVSFINGMYYDTSLASGQNFVKINDTFVIDGFTQNGSNRSISMYDISGTQSTINNVPSYTNQQYLISKNAENNYGYIYPVKFENSKIKSGIFRRSYLSGCEIFNEEYDTLDKLPSNYKNYRSLLFSDLLLNNNLNKIKSGTLIHSNISGGSDIFENGIVINSTWNGDSFTYSLSATGSILNTPPTKFKNGIVKQSKWISGSFENGIFSNNKSNLLGSSIYTDSINSHYSKNFLTRYAWINGEFKNGMFEFSNWENGIFSNGHLYNAIFMDGTTTGGIFGKRSIPPNLTKVLSGSFSNLVVNNAEFKSQNANGSLTQSKSIDWYNGIFNNGIFGVSINPSSYSVSKMDYGFNSTWWDGEFNGGNFTDISIWKSGKFNSGKFTSYYGYPHIPSASYSTMTQSLFSWQGGEFNGGEFGNFNVATNSTWFNGEFNGGIFSGKYWHNGIMSKGHFFGSSTYSTVLSEIPKFMSRFSSEFYGIWNDGLVTEVKDEFIKDKKFFTKIEREFSKKRKTSTVEITNALWKSGTFSHTDGLFNNSVWMGGEFKKGNFKNSSFNPYINFVSDGDFTSLDSWSFGYSDLYGGQINPASGNLVWTGTSSTTTAYQITGLEIGQVYTMTVKIDSIENTELKFGSWTNPINGNFNSIGNWSLKNDAPGTITAVLGAPGHLSFNGNSVNGCYAVIEDILTPGHEYELTFYTFDTSSASIEVGSSDFTSYGIITPDGNASYSTTVIGSNAKNIINFTAEYQDLTFRISGSGTSKINGISLTSNTRITNIDSTSPQTFTFTFSAMGPYSSFEFISDGTNTSNGASWPLGKASINIVEIIEGTSGFNLTKDCKWSNGIFESSEFFISEWENGRWKSGSSYGMIWKNGISDYMNAYNTYWGGGIWRNGNWNGAPFGSENLSLSQSTVLPGFTSDILNNISLYRQSIGDSSYRNIFINNAFTASIVGTGEELLDPEMGGEFISVTQSGSLGNWTWAPDYDRWVPNLFSGTWQNVGSTGDPDPCVIAYATSSQEFNSSGQASNYLYAKVGNSLDIFTSSNAQYDISITYICYFGPTTSSISNPRVRFDIGVGWNGSNTSNGGNKYNIIEEIPSVRLTDDGLYYRGQSNIVTVNYTFAPLEITNNVGTKRLYIQKLSSSTRSTSLHILRISIVKRQVQYDATYNNATYSLFAANPTYSSNLTLPNLNYIGGSTNIGSQISIQFGNGIFESSTFSSIWENGVWNQGMRYDNKISFFDNLLFFPGTSKPISYQGGSTNKGSNERSFAENTSSNTPYTESVISYRSSTWIIRIQKTIGNVIFEDGSSINQSSLDLRSKFKSGDKVAVGNIIGIDINNNRRLLKDYLTVITVTEDTITLEINVNFPLRRIEKDSENHLIYVSKNIWINGAFLNGLFKGIWNNGLFKGYPYITRMIDSQWIDGRFDGGRFRGLTMSLINQSGQNVPSNSAVIQNFTFKDNDISTQAYQHTYNSWIDVNYYTYSTVTVGRNNISFDNGDLFGTSSISIGEYSQTNLYSFPTEDVLSSTSQIRNNFDSNSLIYSLGSKYKEFTNYLENISDLENYYNSDDLTGNKYLITDGFTWSQAPAITNKKLFVDGPATASILSNSNQNNESKLEIKFGTAPATDVPYLGSYDMSNTIITIDNLFGREIPRKRYNYISFDHEVPFFPSSILYSEFGTSSGVSWGSLNLTSDAGQSNISPPEQINLFNRNESVKEYFYNRRNLGLIATNIYGIATSSIIISNLKMVETDMIPFFQLATASRINQSIASPWEAVAPVIDYNDANFSLIDNITLSETTISTSVAGTTLNSSGPITFNQTNPSDVQKNAG